MARKTGQFNYPYNYEVKLTAPLDSRALVDTVDSLINSTTWTDSDGGIYIYNGLLVSVTENNSVYMLTDADNYTNIESWKKINDDTVVLDYTVNVTYSELIELRKNNQLVPGQLYRITDYVTTTAQENTKSAEHQFDIVVRAITENTLSENAKVCAINKNDKEPESVTVVNTELAHTGWSNVEVDAIPDGIKDILNFTPSANTDIKCYTTTVVCGKGDLNSNFKFKSGNKKINCVGVDIVKNNEVINFDYHTGYTGNAHKFNDYTLTIPEYGEYEIRFFINHREEGVDATSILTSVNIAVFDYFDNNDLNAWEIKYCLDNDTSRFAWADPDNGKGVIYYMKDEYGNECHYDFKNIMFLRNYNWYFQNNIESEDAKKENYANDMINTMKSVIEISEETNEPYFYTFSLINTEKEILDNSLNPNVNNNKIGTYVASNKNVLNNTLFINAESGGPYNNIIKEGNAFNAFCGKQITQPNNTIEVNYKYNNVFNSFNNNTIGKSFQKNIIKAPFYWNTIGNKTNSIAIGSDFFYNVLGNNTWHFKTGYKVSYCKIGSYFQYNSFFFDNRYPSEYDEMKYCNFGNGIEGVDYIPPMQNITFEDQCWYGSRNLTFGDLKTESNELLIEKVIKTHNQNIYVYRTKGTDNADGTVRYTAKIANSSILFIGTFESSEDAENMAASIDVCTNPDITFIKYHVTDVGNGIIEQYFDGFNSTANAYYVTQYLNWNGYKYNRQIKFTKDENGICVINDVSGWRTIINNNELNVKLYSDNSEVVNIDSNQDINGVKNFNNDILIADKTRIKTDIWAGEFKVLNKDSNKGFIIRNYDVDNGIKPLELLATNTQSSLVYKFPKTGGTISLGVSINGSNKTPNLDNGIIDLGTGYTKAKNVTYSELFELRDNSQLVPGQLYRITDYVTTTTQENTKSAEHQFDIIVEALTDSILSENVKVYKESDYVNKLSFNMAATAWTQTSSDISANDELNQLLKLIYGKNVDLNNLTNEEKQRVRRASFTRNIEKGILEIVIRLNDGQTNEVTCLGANIIQNNKVIYSNYKKILINSTNNTIKYQLHVPSNGSYIIQIFTDCNYENLSAGSNLTLNAYSCDNFFNNDLNAWEVKYCLDNDTSRFAWADPNNGKGVIYYMKDEFNNEAWYDFKNIMFLRDANWFTSNPKFTAAGNITQNTYFYTFSRVNGMVVDDSLGTGAYPTSDNHLGRNTATITKLNNTIFIGNGAFNNVLADGHGNNTIGVNIWNNIIGHNFTNNIINKNFQYNTIKEGVSKNHIWGNFLSNILESNCTDNRFLGNVDNCLFKQYYEKNNFTGDTLSQCTFGIANNWISDMPSMKNVTFSNNCITGSNSIYLTDLITTNNISLLTELNDIYNTNNNFTYSIYLTNNNKYIILSPNIDKNNEIKITYSELVELRDNSQLVPGQLYRIADYVTTTAQDNTKSAEHQFDIIVRAITENTLSEYAKVKVKENDEYFINNDLNVWEIKYCLDNDTSRFAWADPDNGKGVIYYMKDEYGNEAPYDFKNIMYIKDGEEIPTFGDNCSNNIIKEYKVKNKFNLPNITFGKDCHDNTFGKDCHDNTFENNCNTNTFGKDCHDNTFGKDCHDNTFENNCNTNTFESGCTYNTFGHDCDYNAFESICFNNTFGSSCVNNAFESGCSSNTFGFNCINNTFGDNCKNNTFERFCNNNTFGSKCSTNTFGENCDYNAFESGCTDNTFGSDCTGNTLNELFQGNIVGISFCNNKIGAKYSFNKFGNNCHNLHIIEKQTSGIDSPLQNFNFGAGLTGEIELKGKNIRNRLFETKVCYNSNGDIVQYCEADLVMVNPYEEENNIVTATTTEDSIELTGNIEVGEDEITITGDNIKIINVDNNNNYEIIIE